MWALVLLVLAAGGLCVLGALQEWVTNANRKLYVESYDLNLTIAEREVTRTGNVFFDWPTDENRDDWVRAVAYRDELVRNAYHA